MAPEHRLSLGLKRQELSIIEGHEELCGGLDEVASLPYLDILDESDELMHHRYTGIHTLLPMTCQWSEQ